LRRPFRGAIYEISIKNPNGVEYGVKEITVDGKKLSGNLIKPHKDGKVHKVEVLMGKVSASGSRQSGARKGSRKSPVKV